MPVDDRLQPVLELVHGQPREDDSHLPVWERRARTQAALAAFLAVVGEEPADPAETSEVEIPVGDGRVAGRVYRPDDRASGPAMIYLHGGAWWLGDLDLGDSWCHRVCRSARAVVVSVDYRRAPEHPFPIPWEDGYSALVWVVEHAAELGVDPAMISVCGESAGGNLAVAVSLAARERRRPPIRSLVLCQPALDPTMGSPSVSDFGDGFFLTAAGLRQGWDFYLSRPEDAANPFAAPLQAPDLAGLPPTLVITAEFDPLRDEGEAFGRRLAAAGVPTRVSRYAGMIHGFDLMTRIVPDAGRCVEEVAGFIRAPG